jgi:hypothetical protein
VNWRSLSRNSKIRNLVYLWILFILLALLFYPYLKVSHLYGPKRPWVEIASMLPRPQSYFLTDISYWGSYSKIFASIPMRHEHQMFCGAIPLLLALFGLVVGIRKGNGASFALLSGATGAVILLTLYIGGYSLWYAFHKFPLVSAIRAVTRIDQVLLFPVGYLAAVGVDYLRNRGSLSRTFVSVVVLPLLIVEFSATSAPVSSKQEWRDRLSAKEVLLPKRLHQDSILFIAQWEGPPFADELDAMWLSISHGIKTLNGYSGLMPPNFSLKFGSDCEELPKRLISYLWFIGDGNDRKAYQNLMKRVVPIGFVGCNLGWFTVPAISAIDRVYAADEIRKLTYQYQGKRQDAGQWIVNIKISNAGREPIAARSSVGKPIRLSWRFLDVNGVPKSGWNKRKDLNVDIPGNGSVSISIPVDRADEIEGGMLQISPVQELVFWAHDIGVPPLTIPWEATRM